MIGSRRRVAGPITIVVACVAALLAVGSTSAGAQATATGPFEVNVANREDVRRFFQTVYRDAENVPAGWTGDVATCNNGTLSPAFLDATLSRVNWFRAMAGVPSNITFTAEKNALAQAAGVLQAANPGTFEHLPPATWRCFSQQGFDGSSLSNLGGTGPGGIDGWMFDNGANNAGTGHRRHILNPAQVTMGHGGVPGGPGALHVLGESATPRPVARDEFVAWPNRGFVPYQTVYSRWTFALPPSADVSNATVTMRRGGVDVPLEIIHRESASGFGDSAINWRPTTLPDDSHWPRPTADETYSVTIGNVVIGGVTRTFDYDVTIFDPQVADPTNTRAVITGPDRPTVALPTAYTFNAVPNATGYQWRSILMAPFQLTDGADAGLVNFTPALGTGPQDPLPYNPVSTEIPASGAAGFRLTSSVVGGPQRLTLNRHLLAGADSQVTFRSRAEMLDNHAMQVEVSVDGGATWRTAFTEAAPLGRAGVYSDRVVSLAAFAGQLVHVRLSLVQTGGATWTCCGAIGWYLDDISFNNFELAAPAVLSATAPDTGFTFTPTVAGDHLLQVRPDFFSTGFGDWGPFKRVAATPPLVAPTITAQPAGATVTAGAPVTLSVTATGTAPLRFAWQRDGVALADGAGVAGATTSTLTVTPAIAGSYTVVVSNDAGAMTSAAAVVVVNQAPPPPPGGSPLGDAIDNPALAPTTSGDGLWTAQQTVSRDGVDAARSGVIGNNQTSTMQVSVTGPVELAFWWRVESEATFDFLNVSLDGGAPIDRISGTVEWAEKRITIPAGVHIVRWSYTKDGSVATGADAGWIDQVTLGTAPPPPPPPPGGSPLGDAIDNPALAPTTSGDGLWTAQQTVSRDGVDAARSGVIGNNQTSTMQVSVTGPVELAFWWRVESEATFDFLNVSLDGGAPIDRISGTVEWAEKRITIPAGVHIVRWSYTKDGSVATGADAGWIDQVTLGTAPPPPPPPGGSPLGDAIDNPALVPTTSGDGLWTAQQTVSRDGVDAARSGVIGNNQTSTMQVSVTGPVELAFWWRVESEATFDFLNVSLDGGAPIDRISGTVEWAEKRITIPAGVHIVRWSYTKDGSVATGADAGWIDQVRVI